MLEAIDLCERIAGRELDWSITDDARVGDHRWWISDLSEFRRDYPGWGLHYDLEGIVRDLRAASRVVAERRSRVTSVFKRTESSPAGEISAMDERHSSSSASAERQLTELPNVETPVCLERCILWGPRTSARREMYEITVVRD